VGRIGPGESIETLSREGALLRLIELTKCLDDEIPRNWVGFLRLGTNQVLHPLELQCDGVAVLTLIALDMDPLHFNAAVLQLVRYNERLGASGDAAEYPSLTDRRLLVTILIGRGDRR